MTATSEIPLTPKAQTFSVPIGAVTYGMRLIWCDVDEGGWLLDISDDSGDPLAAGIPLVAGCDLLDQLAYLFDFKLFTGVDGNLLLPPIFNNLGTTAHLWVEQ